MACCRNKKYYTDLCEKCKNDFGAFNYTDLGEDYEKIQNSFNEMDGVDWIGEQGNKSIKCECGSEHVGSSGHSYWCPKFK